MAEFLLEIGVEEMPASWLAGLTEQMRDRFVELARREHLMPEVVEAASTPRRLAVTGHVPPRQPDMEDPVWGPAARIAKDAAGNWTKAAEGFARKLGISVDQLQFAVKGSRAIMGEMPAGTSTEPSEEYAFHVKRIPGRDSGHVLAGIIPVLLRGLTFPKRMSWDAWLDDGKGEFPFGRPIRWVVALLDGQVVPFTIYAAEAGARGRAIVEAGDTTRGHRFLPRGRSGRPVKVRFYDELRQRLEEHFVILGPETRAERIAAQLARQDWGEVDDFGLLAEWKHLVEYPTVVFGSIPEEFRSLPTEVLQVVLVHHQKYIPLVGEGEVGHFAALTDTDDHASGEIVRGMERVVVARLRDAAFFLAEDLERPLVDRLEDLAGVTFHRELGSYREKADRMVALIEDPLAPALGDEGERSAAAAAARLAKADLTTLMVREFPELQGVMGALYLERQGASAVVADAVRWHYGPVSIEEEAAPATALTSDPARRVFAAVSVADKLDTLAGYFGLGLAPTGSSDPYGLRRAGQGVVRALLDFWPTPAGAPAPSLRRLVAAALHAYEGKVKAPAEQVRRDLEAFLLDRLRYVLTARGSAADEVEAVLGAREPDALDDPREAWQRLQALHRVRLEATEDFERLAVAFKRAKNILGESAPAEVDTGLLTEAAERELHDAVAQLRSVDGGYESRLRSLSGLRGPVDRFFDDVLVMAEDPRLRANRLGLLSQALSLFYRIADISKLGG